VRFNTVFVTGLLIFCHSRYQLAGISVHTRNENGHFSAMIRLPQGDRSREEWAHYPADESGRLNRSEPDQNATLSFVYYVLMPKTQ